MPLVRFLIRTSKKMAIAVAVAGLIGGLCSAALIALINTSLHRNDSTSGLLILGIVGVAFAKVTAGAISQWLMARFALTTFLDLTVDLCRRVITVPLQHLEQIGTHRIFTVLTNDTMVLVTAVQAIPGLAINAAVVTGCGIYLFWLYPLGFVTLCVVVSFGVVIFKFLHTTMFSAIYKQREQRDFLVGHYRSLVDGIKELKMHRERGNEFVDRQVDFTVKEVRRYNLIARTRFIFMDSWNQILFYLMIGGILFLFPRDGSTSTEILTGYIFAALYVMAPIWSIIGAIPVFLSGQVSLGKLEELGVLLAPERSVDSIALPEPTNNIELDLTKVIFHYDSADKDNRYPFKLGPIDLTVTPGEILFLVGGNGSGKSTMVNLLAGLYSPKSGEIKLGGQIINNDNRDWYRQHFSVVFSDFYLFDSLLGACGADVDDLSNDYLEKLELNHKVTVKNHKFSTVALSQGQRKRLALLTALIEDRPVYIFDEWAADQDPHYKEIFYSILLPELKAQGKTVIVITHDDRYFSLGDRVIKLQDGRIAGAEANVP